MECLSLVKHPEEHKKEIRLQRGIAYRPCVGWLELVLEVLLALGVLGWRTSKEKNNAKKRYAHYR